MRKQLLLGSVAIVIGAASCGPLAAADLSVPAYKAPPVQLKYDWSGLYVGGHIGFGSARFDFATGINSGNNSGLIGGLHIGRNWLMSGNIVWGLEGDVSFANMHAGQTNPIGASVDLLSSLRGRLGMTFDRVLVYATGGVGYVSGKADADTLGTVLAASPASFRGVVGVGVEYAATKNVVLRAEALDYFGGTTFGLGGDLGNTIGNIWVGQVGASYKF